MKSVSFFVVFLMVIASTSAQVKVIPAGLYYGVLPCTDCKGVETFIELNANKTGIIQELYLGKEDRPRVADIWWKAETDKVEVYEGETLRSQYKFNKNELIRIDNNLPPVKGATASKFVLTKKVRAGMAASWIKMKTRGVDVLLMGNEPSWNIEMDFEKEIMFQTADGLHFSVPAKAPVYKDNKWIFESASSGNSLKMEIEPRLTGDGMSDAVYEYSSLITANGKTYKGVAVLFNPSFVLNGEWQMEYLSGPRIGLEWRKFPSLNFDVSQKRVAGFDGCNRIMGGFTLTENNGLVFSAMAGTLMACPDNNADFFNKAIAKVNRFRFVNGKLELLSGMGLLIRMRRV